MNFLSELVRQEIDKVEDIIHASCESRNMLITEVANYIFDGGGKRLRPALLILTSRGFSYKGKAHLKLAASIELLHTATLLHDDVIDKASSRRGRPSVNARWGDEIAILVADFLYSKAFLLITETLPGNYLNFLIETTTRMCEGEVLEIENRNNFLTCDDYLEIIQLKTAYLFSTCAALGGVVANAAEIALDKIVKYGLNFGMAFQITDDTLDFVAADKAWGKQIGQDFLDGKQTLPLIRTMELATLKEREHLVEIWRDGRDFEKALKYIIKYDAINYSLNVARDYSLKAAAQIEEIPDLKYRSVFIELSEFASNRSH